MAGDMRSLPVMGIALMLALASMAPGQAQLLLVQNKPMEITSDTVTYCEQLSAQVAAARQKAAEVPADVPRLAAEGQKMCDEGLVRPGIQRLRRAWTLLTVR